MSEGTTSQTVADKHVSKKKTSSIVIIIILALLIVGIAYSLLTGLLYVGIKKADQRVVVQTFVCNADQPIKKLNNYLLDIANGKPEQATEAIKYIKSLSNYNSDPTCVEALARFHSINKDIQGLDDQINRLEQFADDGLYPSNRFNGLSSIGTNIANFEGLTGEAR